MNFLVWLRCTNISANWKYLSRSSTCLHLFVLVHMKLVWTMWINRDCLKCFTLLMCSSTRKITPSTPVSCLFHSHQCSNVIDRSITGATPWLFHVVAMVDGGMSVFGRSSDVGCRRSNWHHFWRQKKLKGRGHSTCVQKGLWLVKWPYSDKLFWIDLFKAFVSNFSLSLTN
jgi:hypothetical protein